jgi:hypothetical protein
VKNWSNKSTVKQKMGISVSYPSAKKKHFGQASMKQNDLSKGSDIPKTMSNRAKGESERMVPRCRSSSMMMATSLFNFPNGEWDVDSNTTLSGHQQDGKKEDFVLELKTSLLKPAVMEHNEKKLENTKDSLHIHKPNVTKGIQEGKECKTRCRY